MSLAALSLAALVLAIVISCTSTINVGFLSIVLAWLVGVYLADLRVEQVLAGFPASLFLTLAGVTLLFSMAQVNGTLDRIAHRAVRRASGAPVLIPVIFFLLTAALSSIGPGNIAATALMAPLGMAAAGRHGISPFLMAIMIANGASAGSLSPVTPTGVVVNGIAANIGLPDVRWTIYLHNFSMHMVVAFSGYFLLGGWRLLHKGTRTDTVLHDSTTESGVARLRTEPPAGPPADPPAAPALAFEWRHWATTSVIAALVLGVLTINLHVGLGAFLGAVLLTLIRAGDEKAAVRAMPWNVIMMVCGVTTLVALLDRTGGIELFADFLARVSTPGSATAVAAFFSGAISIYSSTTGVVLPALLPTIPGLIERIGGGDAMALVSSMNVGGHLVDVSPLSTLGALCLAAAPAGTDTRALFNKLLAWGVSMAFVGAAVCWVFFGW
jgi:di/tricarboxylate transporter